MPMKLYKKGYSSNLDRRCYSSPINWRNVLEPELLRPGTNCTKDGDLRDFLVKVRVKADNLTSLFEIVLRLLTKRVVMTMKE